jgi:peptide deformylase
VGARRPGVTGLSTGLGAGLAAPQIGVGLRVFAYSGMSLGGGSMPA